MIEFDWSKLTTIDSNPVTPDTNGYNLETGGLICNQTNQKNGYKRLRVDGTVTTLKKPVTKLVTDNRSNTADVTTVTGVTSFKDKERLWSYQFLSQRTSNFEIFGAKFSFLLVNLSTLCLFLFMIAKTRLPFHSLPVSVLMFFKLRWCAILLYPKPPS